MAQAVSPSTSVRIPPSPTMTTAPNLRVAHAAHDQLDTVREVGHRLDRHGRRGQAVDEVGVRRARDSRSARPTTTPPPSDLCRRPVALSTTGKPTVSSGRLEPGLVPAPTRAAGKTTPASANSARAASYDVSVTGGAGRGGGIASPAVASSTRPASTAHARSTSRWTGMPAARSTCAGGPSGVDRLHDERLVLGCDRVGHQPRGGQLRLGQVGLPGRVAPEVARQQHTVDLVGAQQDRLRGA